MSVTFSSTANKNGIIQLIERNIAPGQDGFISGNTTRLAQFTADINLALDRAFALIFQVGGTWQLDDSSHTDYPIITTNLVSGQRDYSFTTDGSGNLILEIYKVMVADENGNYREITPVDVPAGAPSNFYDGLNTTGQPNTYDKLGNGIFLDPIPNYSETNGLKIYINREASYFVVGDTTKKPGIAGLFHEYLALRPSFQYAYRNSLANTASLETEMLKMEAAMMDYYKSREKDVQKTMMGAYSNSH